MVAPDPRQLAAQVAAWHNRNPLARRILPAQVQGIGVVAMPFVAERSASASRQTDAGAGDSAQPSASLRERALAKAEGGSTADRVAPAPPDQAQALPTLRGAFDEDFAAPISARGAAVFAASYGADVDPAAGGWPLRRVLVDAQLAKGQVTIERYIRTAAIECAGRRIRLLVAAADGDAPAILGPRVLSRTRIAAVLAPLCLIPALAYGVWHGERPTPPPPLAPMAMPAAPSVVEPPVLPVPSHEPAAEVQIPPRLDPETARRARRESAALRAAALLPVEQAAQAAAANADAGKTFALVARETRSRAASAVLLGLMQATAARQGQAGTHRDVLTSGAGYRASWWPFTSRGDAERAREQLASVGLPVDVVEF